MCSSDLNREVGAWWAMNLQEEFAPIGSAVPITMSTADQIAIYYRHALRSELDMTFFTGFEQGPGSMFGGTYLEYRLTRQMALLFQGMIGFDRDDARAIYAGFRLHCKPLETYSLISGNPQNRYRPFMRTLDHINFQLRKTSIFY